MRRLLFSVLAASLFVVPTAQAAILTFITGQTGAQTQIDINHSTIINFTLPVNDPSLTLIGDFTLKRGPQTDQNNPATDLFFRLFDAPDATGTILDVDSKAAAAITQQFTSGYMFTLGPRSLGPGPYSVALQSLAPDEQAKAYFIKGIDEITVTCAENQRGLCDGSVPIEVAPEVVPEPASMSLLGLGLLAGARRLRRR